jgi:hypothetical protein
VSSAHNVSGQVYSLTVITPILSGHETQVAHYLDSLQSGDQSPLAGVRGTHFARWVVMDDVIYQSPDQGDREHLKHARLLFTSNFDGKLEPYLEAMRTGLSDSADAIWGHCIGYPGTAEASGFANYMRHHQIDSSLFFAAYGERKVEEVKRSLALRIKFVEFALRTQGLSARELQVAFLQEFSS